MFWEISVNFLLLLFTVLIPTSTMFAQETVTCPGFLPSRLMVGEQGRVTPGDANNVRSEPSTQSEHIGQIRGGEMFTVLEGPTCDGNYAWWKIEYNGLTGWTVEGSGDVYWLEPVAAEAESTPASTAPAFNLENLTKREVDFTRVEAAAWSPDGRWLAVVENDGLWIKDYTELDAGARLLLRGRIANFGRTKIAFMPNTNILAYTDSSRIQFVDVVSGESETFVEGSFSYDLAFSPDGQLLAVVDYDKMKVWEIASRTLRWEYEDKDSIDELAFSPDSALLVLANEAKQLIFWNAYTGEQIGISPLYDYGGDESEQIYDLVFSPDGKRLAVGTSGQVAL
jgi:WD40 repeat protein